ncbi:hypothetical protein RHMOL_Rhmol07G0284900 [Rhododendron molle]|uniref:Uncharacterized protein n=1 Tax=Rhododendron molle TaxID=49168 RepID=A0ACC0N7G4_RHOML|nr:hypothetical protein RHMOL_Rhmol07G0284900 [Rhododendron molle]
MMKGFVFWVAGTALVLLSFSIGGSTSSVTGPQPAYLGLVPELLNHFQREFEEWQTSNPNDFSFWFSIPQENQNREVEIHMAFTRHEDDTGVMTGSRKLKEIGHTSSTGKSDRSGSANLEDYEPIDPVPSSMTSIRPGPIQHGTPLMPYIPRPSPPPEHPKLGGFP